jgi:hypothetical protein
MRIAIVGSRTFTDYQKLKSYVLSQIRIARNDIIISGGAKGADTLAELFADELHLEKKIFYADWDTHGKAAGPIRNTLIVDNADVIVAFPDKNSRGTWDTIQKAKAKNIKTLICEI